MDSTTPSPRATPPVSTASPPDLVGETFDDFRILRRLGQGGMGQVYLAEQISLKRKVAVKMLREDIAAHPTALARFKVESTTVARLSHANIVQVHTFGEHQGRLYMVLEYVEGKNLCDYVLRQGPLDAPLALSIMRQVASALQRAGELGIVHRDIKPENILLTRKGEAKVADFGLACCLAAEQPVDLTRAGATVGTPLFMSPEQVQGKAVDQRSDIYSFGVTCYQMLTGRTPFQGSTALAVALKHVGEEPPPLASLRPDLPPALCAVVHKMLAKTRRSRYQTARELLKDIARVRESLGGTTATVPVGAETMAAPAAETPRPRRPFWKRRKVRRWAVRAAVGLGVLTVLIVVAAVVWHFVPAALQSVAVAPPPPPPATTNAAGSTPPPPPSPTPPAPAGSSAPVSPTPTPMTPPPAATAPPAADPAPPAAAPQDREEALRKLVDQHLQENSPDPTGVEDCIALGVLYLDRKDVSGAAALFGRMDERRSPPAYHLVGRLGLAVTDALKNDYRDSYAKFVELFDPKNHDDRREILNDYLAKNPDFAAWVNEADALDIRNGLKESPLPQGNNWRHFPTGRPTFHRP